MDVHGPIEVAVISGVGQAVTYQDVPVLEIDTPYGPTSTPISVIEVRGHRVAVISRRGPDDDLQPHLVPYRANIWALASVGVKALITSTVSSGLSDAFSPGTFVVTDQLIDRTSGRATTFYDHGPAVQLSGVGLFDPTLRRITADALTRQGVRVLDFGATVVINGPRFSTAAESRFHAAIGGDLVNMSLMPEVALARELGIAVVNVSTIADRGSSTAPDQTDIVNLDYIRRRSAQARTTLSAALRDLVPAIPRPFIREPPVPYQRINEILALSPHSRSKPVHHT